MVLDYTIQSIINKFTCLLYTLALYKSSMFFTKKIATFIPFMMTLNIC